MLERIEEVKSRHTRTSKFGKKFTYCSKRTVYHIICDACGQNLPEVRVRHISYWNENAMHVLLNALENLVGNLNTNQDQGDKKQDNLPW